MSEGCILPILQPGAAPGPIKNVVTFQLEFVNKSHNSITHSEPDSKIRISNIFGHLVVCMEGGCFGLRPLVGVFINIMVVCSRRGFVCEGVVAKFAFLAQMEQLQGHI
jgi:hypothetical protein